MSNKMTKNETLTLKMPSLGFIKSHDRGMFTVSNTLKCLIADEAVSLRLESRIFSLSCLMWDLYIISPNVDSVHRDVALSVGKTFRHSST